MFDFIRAHQLNVMLVLCGACGVLAFTLFITRFLSKSRKKLSYKILPIYQVRCNFVDFFK